MSKTGVSVRTSYSTRQRSGQMEPLPISNLRKMAHVLQAIQCSTIPTWESQIAANTAMGSMSTVLVLMMQTAFIGVGLLRRL